MDDTGPGLLRERHRLRRARASSSRAERDRARRRQDLPRGGRHASPPAASPTRAGASAALGARIEVDDKVVAKNVGLQGEGRSRLLPALHRTTRSARTSARRAFSSRTSATRRTAASTSAPGFFWAMGRSVDQTFYADYYSKIGYGFGHELRYAAAAARRAAPSAPTSSARGGRRHARLRPRLERAPDAARQGPGHRQRPPVQQPPLPAAATRTTSTSPRPAPERSVGVAREGPAARTSLSLAADTTSTYFGTDYTRVNGRLPGAAPAPLPAPDRVGQASCSASRPRPTGSSTATRTRSTTGRGIDIAPQRLAALRAQLPRVHPVGRLPLHPLRRELRLTEEDARPRSWARPIDRPFFEAQLEMRGPTFSRVFDTPGLRLLGALQAHDRARGHLDLPDAGRGLQRDPEVRRRRLLPRHQPDRLLAGAALLRQAPRADRQAAALRVPVTGGSTQTYYVQIADGQNNFDPNYSSSAFGPGFKPEHLSPLMSRLRAAAHARALRRLQPRVRRQLQAAPHAAASSANLNGPRAPR